jgi:hypothetical protein
MPMPILFNCPNGHRLNSPEQQAGKPGKCPKCGAVFRVPQPQTAAPATAAETAKAAAEGYTIAEANTAATENGSEQPANAQMAAVTERAKNEFAFLCPNGHRLHGPASMVGKPGQCPHCQIRFLVPSPDDVPDDDAQGGESALDQLQIHVDTSPRLSSTSSSISVLNPGKSSLGPAPDGHPLALLFGQLWVYKSQGGIVELHLGDGRVVIPDEYARHMSYKSHGLFAVREANGTHTLTAVAWDSITRVAVRGIERLPKELFGG